jgi:hypothetical protein
VDVSIVLVCLDFVSVGILILASLNACQRRSAKTLMPVASPHEPSTLDQLDCAAALGLD